MTHCEQQSIILLHELFEVSKVKNFEYDMKLSPALH